MNIKPVSSSLYSSNLGKRSSGLKTVSVSQPFQANSAVYFGKDLLIKKQPESLPSEISRSIPAGKSIYELIQMAQNDENKIGQGANSSVYNIPYLNDYVLKVLNKDDPNKINMNEFPADVNLGQPVWQDETNPRRLILKKIEGTEHSVPNWSRVIWNHELNSPMPVTREQAVYFLREIQAISDMEQTAFDKLAADVKTLDEKGYKLDSINPNNLIVDEKNNRMHIIDYFKVKPDEMNIYRNSCMDLVAVISDFTLFPEYYDKLTDEEKQDALTSVINIKEKMYKGAERAGLSCDDNRFKTYINATSRWFTAHSVPNENTGGVYFRYYDVRMEDFMKMLENPSEWAENRKE